MAHTPFSDLLQKDLDTLEKNLRALLNPHLKAGQEHLSLLNVACGRGDETGVLAKLLGEKAKGVHLQGLDIRAAQIGQAGSRWKEELPKIASNVSADFITHRGDRLADLGELDTPDLAFLRHQNFWNDRPVWTKIFGQTLDQLDDDGLLVITSYFDKEHELAVEALKKLGAIQVDHLTNSDSRALSDAPGKSVDKHLAVFKKP